jgi:hypothetical protein
MQLEIRIGLLRSQEEFQQELIRKILRKFSSKEP